MTRTLFAVLAVVLLTLSIAPAKAEVEGPHISLSPHIGGVWWGDTLPLQDKFLVGGRVGVHPSVWFGFEGTFDLANSLNQATNVDVKANHLGGDLIIHLAPYSKVNPYITGGWAQHELDPDDVSRSVFTGWEAGGGVKIRLANGDGKRLDLRLDVRDVFARFDSPFDATQETRHVIFATAGVQLALGLNNKDTDGDGVSDRKDQCPSTPLGAWVDEVGCPADEDRDKVLDGLDECPETPLGATVNGQGCPSDRDGDGVLDGLDACPDSRDGAPVDERGCVLDGDSDGVPNDLDKCPDTPSGYPVNTEGCSLDTDGDGVPDGADRCPGTPADVEVDEVGCPVPQSEQEVELLDTGMLRMDNIYFDSNEATLQPRSFPALDEVGRILASWPQLRIEVAGHTDSQGPEQHNLDLSRRRAQSVLDYLSERYPDVRFGQFQVRGYGETQSIDTNKTSEGRARNRRVEFRVLNREVLKRSADPTPPKPDEQ